MPLHALEIGADARAHHDVLEAGRDRLTVRGCSARDISAP
jgi:hypothetical protein